MKFTKSHEWILINGDTATVGITDHAQDALGDITFVELPHVSDKLTKGKECCVVESVKAASDIYSPISGEVSEVNTDLETSPENINKDPYGSGWIYKLKNFNLSELNDLMEQNEYDVFLVAGDL